MESTIADMMTLQWWTISRLMIAAIWTVVFIYIARDCWRG